MSGRAGKATFARDAEHYRDQLCSDLTGLLFPEVNPTPGPTLGEPTVWAAVTGGVGISLLPPSLLPGPPWGGLIKDTKQKEGSGLENKVCWDLEHFGIKQQKI